MLTLCSNSLLKELERKVEQLLARDEKLMATVAQILAAQQQEKADIATLAGLVTQLLTAFAAGTLSPADAQSILNEVTSEDQSITGMAASVTAALNPPPPAPTTT